MLHMEYSKLKEMQLTEVSRTTLRKPIRMPLIGMSMGNRESKLAIKLELLRDDLKWPTGDFTNDRPVQDIVGYFSNICRELIYRNCSANHWKWCFVVTPIKSPSERLISSEWKVLLHDCFVVSKWTGLGGKEFPPLSICLHTLYDLRDKSFIFTP